MATKKSHCEVLTLSLGDLEKVSLEFMEAYKEIFDRAHLRLQRQLKVKMAAVQHCREHLQQESESVVSSSDQANSNMNLSVIDSSFMRKINNKSPRSHSHGKHDHENSLEREHHLQPIDLYQIDQENSSFFESQNCDTSSCSSTIYKKDLEEISAVKKQRSQRRFSVNRSYIQKANIDSNSY